MIKQRRQFIKGLSFGLILSQLPAFASSDGDFFAICDDSGEPQIYNQTEFVKASKGFLKVWQMGSEKEDVFDLPFAGHSIAQNPSRLAELAVFSRWGDQAALVDLKDKKNIRLIKEEKNRRFFGHGIFSHDGKKLYTSQTDDTTKTGEIVVRDVASLKVISRFSVYGRFPYELQFAGSEMIVAVSCDFKDAINKKVSDPHFAEESSLTYIDSSTGKFVKRIKLDKENCLMHFQIGTDGWVVGVGQANDRDTSEKKSYAISISPSGKVKTLDIPDDFRGYFYGETLGIAMLEKKSLAYVTNRSTKLILIWNYKTQELVKYFYIPDRPKAIATTSDLKQVVVAETKTKSFLFVDSKTMEITGRAKGNELSGYGAHMIRLKDFS